MNILFDIGGSRMRFAEAIGTDRLSEPVIVKTPDTYVAAITAFKKAVEDIAQEKQVDQLIGGIAGMFDKEGKKLLLSPNLREWEEKPLTDDLARMTGAKQVVIKNDTDMTGLGEAVFGAGREHKIVAYLTFSTGVGGSLIVDQKIAPYRLGFEPGWQIIDKRDMKSLHSFSGTDLKEKYGKLFRDITDGAIRENVMKAVTIGIHNTIVYWSPDVVVLGGGMTESFDIDSIRKALEKIPLSFPELPVITLAQIGDINGLYGGLAYLKMQS